MEHSTQGVWVIAIQGLGTGCWSPLPLAVGLVGADPLTVEV